MAKVWVGLVAGLAVAISLSPGMRAQTQQGAAKAPPGPAPVHDLTGVWNSFGRGVGNSWTRDPAPLTDWGQAKFKEAKSSNGGQYTLDQTNDPVITKCYPPGTPRIYMQPFPFQIVQTPTEVIILYEYDHTVRHIALNQPIPQDPDPTYMGTSVGKWADDTTLVVDTVGFNENTWLDRVGTPHSEQLHVTEKFHRVDKDNMDIEISMVDPKALTQPWGNTMHFRIHPTWNIMEQVCADNGSFLSFEKSEDKGK